MITVRRATLEDKPAIDRFIQAAYKDHWQYKIPERWQWAYMENPFLDGSELPVWIAVDESGTVIGQTCAQMQLLKLGDRIYRLGWSVDTFVDPAYRGQGIGFQLQRANDQGNEIFMSLSMTPPNRRIKASLGSVPIDPVPAYTLLMRYESVRILIDRFAGLVNLRNRARGRGRVPDESISVTEVSAFGDEADRLWDKISPRFYAIVRRDQVYLNWKYAHQPHMEYHKFIARRDGETCGHIILRKCRPPERAAGIIADLFVAPDDMVAICTMLVFAMRYFHRTKVDDIVAATSVRQYQEALETLGFRKTGQAVPMFHSHVIGSVGNAVERKGWFFSKSDHDWDQYPLVR